MPKKESQTCYLLRLDSYDGADTFLNCGNARQDHLYCIVTHSNKGELEIIDNGYRTKQEALAAWPEIRDSQATRPPKPTAPSNHNRTPRAK